MVFTEFNRDQIQDGESTIHTDIAGEISGVLEKTTPVGADLLIIEDSEDSDNKKSVQIENLPSSGDMLQSTYDPAGVSEQLVGLSASQDIENKKINTRKGADIPSAATTDIGAATGNYIDITGTTTITGLGTVQAGTERKVRFTGILTLTYNATSLILPSAANITTAVGDTATFISLGGGNWICTDYQRADGTALASAGGGGGSRVSVYINSSQSISSGVTTKIQFDTEVFDTESEFDTTTNYRFTASSDGYYMCNMHIYLNATTGSGPFFLYFYKNGTQATQSVIFKDATGSGIGLRATALIQLNTNDYIEGFVLQSTGLNKSLIQGQGITYIDIFKLS